MKKYFLGTLLALFSLGSIGLILGVLILLVAPYHYGKDLPDYKQLKEYKPAITTRLYADDGSLIAEYATEKRVFVPIHAIPQKVIYAFLSAEDQNFFSHKGIDFYGVARAMINNVKNVIEGQRLEGASTITQQVAKNFLLTNEVSLERKIKEALLALRMEKAFSKKYLLELYLNQIYLGNRSYGVAAAALNYFNKSLDELSLSDVALLAALPKAPSTYDPFRNPERAKERRDWVLKRMYIDGRISQDQMEHAILQPLDLQRRNWKRVELSRYFAEEVRRELVTKYGDEVIYLGGLSVRTSLDPALQKIAVNSLRDGLEEYDRRHGYRGPVTKLKTLKDWSEQLNAVAIPEMMREDWLLAVVLKARDHELEIGLDDGSKGKIPLKNLSWARKPIKDGLYLGDPITVAHQVVSSQAVILVKKDNDKKDEYFLRQVPKVNGAIMVMNPHSGRVLALQGGYSGGVSSFNRATQAKRQPGSAFKPFVYAAALDEGFTPSNLILDAPFVIEQGPGLPKWRPSNYDENFYGPTPLRVGIEKSRNLMTVRLANHVGMQKIADYAERFGVTSDLPQTLAMALGAGETTLFDLTTGYGVFVNGGKKLIPTFVDRIQDREGRTIYRGSQRVCQTCDLLLEWDEQPTPQIQDNRKQVVDPKLSYQIVSMLEGVVQRGTARRLKSLDRPIAGKTGTTNESKDAWFIGFTPDLLVGVFVGFDEPKTLGKQETGSSVAVPIFKKFIEQALSDQSPVPFRVPEGLNLVKVNATTGEPATAGDSNIIWEAFLPGTEPKNQQYILDTEGLNQLNNSAIDQQSTSVGTGGLY